MPFFVGKPKGFFCFIGLLVGWKSSFRIVIVGSVKKMWRRHEACLHDAPEDCVMGVSMMMVPLA